MVGAVERVFSQYSRTEPTSRTAHLQEFLHQCAKFKRRLERQEHTYRFESSDPGTAFVPEKMRSLMAEESPDSAVLLSLWPSLWKDTKGESRLIEHELVWTINPVPSSEASDSDPEKKDCDFNCGEEGGEVVNPS